MHEYAPITLDMIEYAGIYQKNSAEYARIVNMSDAVHSLRSHSLLISCSLSNVCILLFNANFSMCKLIID